MSKQFSAITIPKWGIEMTQGTVVEWHKNLGDEIAAGDDVVDIESDKTVNSFEARASGTLVRILAEEGDEYDVGTLIGVLALDGSVDEAAIDAFIAEHRGEEREQDASEAPVPDDRGDRKASEGAPISPALKRKLAKAGIDPATVTGTGPRGRILKEDVDQAIERAAPSGSGDESQPAASDSRALVGAQKVIASKLTEAQQNVPIYHVTMDLQLDSTLNWLEANDSISINDVLVKALGAALTTHPQCNVQFDGQRITDLHTGSVAIAVATDGAVHAPVVASTEKQSWAELHSALTAAVDQAREGRLTSALQGPAAATVSNLGMFGVREFTAMVTPPQVLVLSVGEIRRQPALDAQGGLTTASIMTVTLGCDHRVINGADAARLLAAVKANVEAPDTL